MSYARISKTEINKNPGELLYHHLKNRYQKSEERRAKIEEIRVMPGGIVTIQEAMKIDQPLFDKYQAELKPMQQARNKAEYDHWETHVWDACDGTTIEIGVGGEAARLDEQIKSVEFKYEASLAIYKELAYAVSKSISEREEAERTAKAEALKRESEAEFNDIIELTRRR